MRTTSILLIFLFSYMISSSQVQKSIKIKKEPTDTIDYFYLNYLKGYHVVSVVGKSGKMPYNCPIELKFAIGLSDTIKILDQNHLFKTKYTKADTLISIQWYVNNFKCLGASCGNHGIYHMAKMKLKNNIISLEKIPCVYDKDVGIHKFKVIKFSEYEIILQDLQKKSQLLYYFIKN